MDFKLVSDYKPTGDQPEAIDGLVRAIDGGEPHNTLLGVCHQAQFGGDLISE